MKLRIITGKTGDLKTKVIENVCQVIPYAIPSDKSKIGIMYRLKNVDYGLFGCEKEIKINIWKDTIVIEEDTSDNLTL